MKRITLDISPDQELWVYKEPHTEEDTQREIGEFAQQFAELAPGGLIISQYSTGGHIRFMLPAEWQAHRLPKEFDAWVLTVIPKAYTYDFDIEEGYRPESLIPEKGIKRDHDNTIYSDVEREEVWPSNITLYFASFERDEIGYGFDTEGHIWAIAKLFWPPFRGDCWQTIHKMPDNCDILDLIHVRHDD